MVHSLPDSALFFSASNGQNATASVSFDKTISYGILQRNYRTIA